jgi:hypothetical protein
MLAVAFDTLKLARKLESAGMAPKQAQDTSAALSETFTEWLSVGNIATREDVQQVRSEIQQVKFEILRWMFAQTIVVIGALFALIHYPLH